VNPGTVNLSQASFVMASLVRLGVEWVIISPGSRSTPLTIAAAREPGLRPVVHFDERGAAFHALGIARSTGKPAALVCTSGTALANYYPAVIEAEVDRLPMLLLTADRPDELIEQGANQTIQQRELYGSNVRTFRNIAPPDVHKDPEQLQDLLCDAYQQATGKLPGPVHLNFQYREPLHPEGLQDINPWTGIPLESLTESNTLTDPFPALGGDGLILLGRMAPHWDLTGILPLAERLGWPIFPDVQSQFRFRRHPLVINNYDLILAGDLELPQKLTVLHLGGPFLSKRLLQWIETEHAGDYYHLAPQRYRYNPGGRITTFVHTTFGKQLDQICPDAIPASPHAYLADLQRGNAGISTLMDQWAQSESKLSEAILPRLVLSELPPGNNLHLASSMPVRDFDMFSPATESDPSVYANRGVSGIDGTIATAAGITRATRRATTLVIGDLAFLHDLNSLALCRDLPAALRIIVINNNGGGIFHFLPVNGLTEVFEPYFGTPHGLDSFQEAAGLFNLDYQQPSDLKALRGLLGTKQSKSSIIEVVSDRNQNAALHQQLLDRAGTILSHD
jgi:2-succinyl-5-enolpyruvyl-6-hydroxy-3-cyclohexene-1-carboxylate synthase